MDAYQQSSSGFSGNRWGSHLWSRKSWSPFCLAGGGQENT